MELPNYTIKVGCSAEKPIQRYEEDMETQDFGYIYSNRKMSIDTCVILPTRLDTHTH